MLDDENGYHAGVQRLVRDLNQCYRSHPPLYESDYTFSGFQWLVSDDHENSVFAFLRRDNAGNEMLVVSNFTPVPRQDYRIDVPNGGRWHEVLNTDSGYYNGSNERREIRVKFTANPSLGIIMAISLSLTLPPLATLFLLREGE